VGGIAGIDASLTAAFSETGGGTACCLKAEAPLELRGPFRGAPMRLSKYFLRNTTAGVLGGDRFSVQVLAGNGTRVQVASSAATKVFAMPRGGASLDLKIEALPGSFCVWGPHPTILQAGADLTQATSIVVHGGAALIAAEVLVLGRLASGETCRFRRFESSFSVSGPTQPSPIFEERYCLHSEQDLGPSLGGNGAVASVFALGIDVGPAIDHLRRCEPPDSLAGFSALPNGAGLVARQLSSSLSAGVRFCEEVIAIVVASSRAAMLRVNPR
jgi:urease accessory protein UreH